MGKGCTHSSKLEKDTQVILHIYGDREVSHYFMIARTRKYIMVNTNEHILPNIHP